MTVTTKAALAAELKISKARVSQYVKAGMPVRSDGKLNREEALRWVSTNQLSQTYEDKGANRARKLEKPSRFKVSSAPMVDGLEPEVVVARDTVGPVQAIIARHAIALGVSIEVAYALSLNVALEVDEAAGKALARMGFEGFAKGFSVGELCNPRQFPEPDWAALARKAGMTFDEAACERFYEGVEADAAA